MPWSAVPAVPPRSNPHQPGFLALLQITLQTLLQMLQEINLSSGKDQFQYLKQNVYQETPRVIHFTKFLLNQTTKVDTNANEQLQ